MDAESKNDGQKEDMVVSIAVKQYQLPPYELIKGLFADYQGTTYHSIRSRYESRN